MKESKNRSLRIINRDFPLVETVRDSDEPVFGTVTARDIMHGILKDPKQCPLARAIGRATKADGVLVYFNVTYVIKKRTGWRYTNPPTSRQEILCFDRRSQFMPGVYRISAVSPSQRFDYERPKRRGSGKRSKLRSLGEYRHYTQNVRETPR